jgi:penicillin amidase
VDGNLAYYAGGEIPLREDLEMGSVDGVPPFLVRDGLGPNNWVPDPAFSQGQAIPYAILPFGEMPQTVNPTSGYLVNANNDPVGVTLDNDPLNQIRSSSASAIYYLGPKFSNGLRAGRIDRLLQASLGHRRGASMDDMMRFQANTQQLDAELMTPFLLEAFSNAGRGSAPSELAALAEDPGVAEAVGRLADWDFSTPTGIPEGYDAADTNGRRKSGVPRSEREASVAATIYNLWRGKLIRETIDTRLVELGAPGTGSRDALKAIHHLLATDPYTGVGASGVDFIPEPAALNAEERRDLALLSALRSALDALASNQFAPAFGNSTDQDDYRWGKLHRIVFDHEFDADSSVPPLGGFDHLDTDLRGVSRDGGYEVVNASGFSARAVSLNSFMFGGGAARRYVGTAGAGGVEGYSIIPGGPSSDPSDPLYMRQLGLWLTADYHTVDMSPGAGGVVIVVPD